jgi:hypothetical protein
MALHLGVEMPDNTTDGDHKQPPAEQVPACLPAGWPPGCLARLIDCDQQAQHGDLN